MLVWKFNYLNGEKDWYFIMVIEEIIFFLLNLFLKLL